MGIIFYSLSGPYSVQRMVSSEFGIIFGGFTKGNEKDGLVIIPKFFIIT